MIGRNEFRAYRHLEPGEDDLIEIFADGRIVWFFEQHLSKTEHVGMTMRFSPEANDVFRVRTTPDAPGYLVMMRLEGTNLVIVNKGRRFIFRKLIEQNTPSWFGEARMRAVWR